MSVVDLVLRCPFSVAVTDEIYRTDPCSPRVRAMMEEYDLFEFGPDNDHFGDIAIYVRRRNCSSK